MGMPGRKLDDHSITFSKLSPSLQSNRYMYVRCDHQPSITTTNGYGDPTGAAGNINRCLWRGGYTQYCVLGTQTLLGPLLDTTGKGVDMSQDQTDNRGAEHVFGANNTFGPTVCTVGTDSAFVRVKFRIADVSGTDDCALGFRKVEAFQPNVDDYDEAAFLNVILGSIKVETILNGAPTVTTTTGLTWADDETHTLEVQLRGRSVAYLVDGARVSNVPEYLFDLGEIVVPTWYFLQATTLPGKIWWVDWETGPMSEKGAVVI